MNNGALAAHLADSKSALKQIRARIAAAEAMLGKAKHALQAAEEDQLGTGAVRAEVYDIRRDLDDLHYQRRRLQRFEE